MKRSNYLRITVIFLAAIIFVSSIPSFSIPNLGRIKNPFSQTLQSFAESPPAWANTTSLPAHRGAAGTAFYLCTPTNTGQGSGATNYCLGYNSTSGVPGDEFFSSTMSSTGLGSWTRLASDAVGVQLGNTELFFYTGSVMVVGGLSGGNGLTNVYSYNGAWHSNTSYPDIQYALGCASTTGLALCVGGDQGGVLTKAAYNWNGTKWSSKHQYPIGIYSTQCVGYSGDIYCMGGRTNASNTKNTYYTADGITWTATTSLPAGFTTLPSLPNGGPFCTEDQGYVYCLDGAATPLLFYAQLSGSGIGAWSQATNAPQKLASGYDVSSLFSYDNAAGALFACHASSSASGTSVCEFSTPNFTFTETLVCKLLSTGGSAETVTLSGAASPSPATASCSTGAGSSNSITVNPSAALTATVAADLTNSRYRGNASWTSGTSYTFTTGSSAEQKTLYNYQELQNTYAMNPSSPSKWDQGYTKNPTGTVLGAASTNICTITLANGGGSANCAGWADNNTAASLPSSFSALAGSWVGTAPTSFTDISGGNTRTVNYAQQSSLTITNPQGLAIKKTNGGVTSTVTSTSFTVDYGSSLSVSSLNNQIATYTVTSSEYVYEESSQGFVVLSNTSIASLTYDGTSAVLSWICTAACSTSDFIPSGFINNIQTTSSGTISVTGSILSLSGNSQLSVTFQGNGIGQNTPPIVLGGGGTSAATTQSIQTTTGPEDIIPGVDALGSCTSIPVTNTTTVTSLRTVTYTSAGSATTYTTRIHVDRDDDPLADRNKADRDDFNQVISQGPGQNVTTTLTQSQTATITYQSASCSFTTVTTSMSVNLTTSVQTNSTMPHPHPAIPPGQSNSTNWAGYVVQSYGITDVKGSFIIPQISCASGGYIALWAGIDGYTSATVEQGGVLGQCQLGNPSYYAWFEFYPSPVTQIVGMTVTPGDKMFIEVSYQSPNFLVNVQDISRNESYSTLQQVANASMNSAEWITEAPSSNGVLPLAAFGKDYNGLNYTGIPTSDFVTVNGSALQIGYHPSIAVTLVEMFAGQNQIIAYPSPLTSDQGSFIVYGTAVFTTELVGYLPWLAIILIIIGVIYFSRKKNARNKLMPSVHSSKGLRILGR